MSFARSSGFAVFLLLLGACTPAPLDSGPAAAELPAPAVREPSADDGSSSVKDLMGSVVMPNAEQLWRAVSYVSTEQGVTETTPQTAEDWSQLRDSANALIAAGDELMNTNREIHTSDIDESTASFQFTPDEIKQLLAENPQPWQSYAQQMQESTRMTLQAIEFRDVMGLVEFGAEINEACEACHAAYLYRPQGMMAPQ